MDKAICPTAIPGLYVMRSGRSSGVVSNLLHSSRLPELLQQLRNDFDSVVIDTPPALHLSDARVIGRLADAVLLIIRAGQTTRDAALMVKQRFGEDGTPLLGTILNGWNPKHDVYGYKYRYYNGNGFLFAEGSASGQEQEKDVSPPCAESPAYFECKRRHRPGRRGRGGARHVGAIAPRARRQRLLPG